MCLRKVIGHPSGVFHPGQASLAAVGAFHLGWRRISGESKERKNEAKNKPKSHDSTASLHLL